MYSSFAKIFSGPKAITVDYFIGGSNLNKTTTVNNSFSSVPYKVFGTKLLLGLNVFYNYIISVFKAFFIDIVDAIIGFYIGAFVA